MFAKKNRVYIFDWDDNIMSMPSRILVERLEDGKWVEDSVTTDEWAQVRHNDHYRPSTVVDNPFLNFREDSAFINDLLDAIEVKSFGPSYNKFKEAMLYGHEFAIVTARGHSREAIINGVMLLIGKTFTKEEMLTFMEVVGDIPSYLSRQEYWTVSAPHFEEHFPQVKGDYTTELRKSIVLRDYIERKIKGVQEIDVMAKISIGFSDDDKRNVIAVKKLKEELKQEYPNVNFVVYDTSNPEKIEKTSIK